MPLIYLACEKADLNHTSYTILYGMFGPLMSLSAMWESLDKPLEYPGMKMEKLY